MDDNLIDKAVEWWADKLAACKHSGLSPEERRDPANRSYQIAEAMMRRIKPQVNDEQVANFKKNLRDLIVKYEPHCLHVDYNPDHLLSMALEAALISSDLGTLPIKTMMVFNGGKVEVSYGYGAPYVEL